MSERKHLSNKPHHAKQRRGRHSDPDVWWYDEPNGMSLMVDRRAFSRRQPGTGCVAVIIPYRQLRALVDRIEKHRAAATPGPGPDERG